MQRYKLLFYIAALAVLFTLLYCTHHILFCGPACKRNDGGCVRKGEVFYFPPTCSHDQLKRNVKELDRRGGIRNATKCPTEPYLIEQFRSNFKRQRKDKIVFIEVGCNKATDAVMMLRMFTQHPRVDLKLWMNKTQFVKQPSCAIDWDLWNKIEKSRVLGDFNYQHYCIEPIRENFEVVKRVSNELGYNRMGLSIHQAAMSNSYLPSTLKFPEVGKSGIETYGIHNAYEHVASKEREQGKFYEVKLTSVDKFVLDEGISQVDILKIDTEGNDALVLLGSVRTLSNLHPRFITFENHGIGHWKKSSLKETIDLLDGLSYTCFWAMYDGFLIRITNCWDSSYEYKGWSNIACYNRNYKKSAIILESYAL